MALFMVYSLLTFIGYALAFQQVKVSEGFLEGTTFLTEDGRTAHRFLGIPFATPPIGDPRFKAPLAPARWNGIRQAKDYKSVCKCYSYQNHTTDEDCLYLDIYTTNFNSSKNLFPTMIFIPGGGFQMSVREFISDWLIMENVVLVTIVYRVGVFGFLSMDTPEVPGNAGLKDQVAALKWIKKNIAAFGGDPDNITIFGQSAGGASVNYHLVSDMSKGLFHKAVLLSGSALNPWAYVKDTKKFENKLCNFYGCPTERPSEALACLQTISADDLLHTVGNAGPSNIIATDNMYLKDFVFLPSIETTFDDTESFLIQSAYHRMITGNFHKVPTMAGFTDSESIDELADAMIDPVLFGLSNINFERYVPKELCLEIGSNESISVANQIKEFYYGEETIDENMEYFVQIKSDTSFKRGINKMVKLLANKSSEPVYYYSFSFYDPDLRKARYPDFEYNEGASHVDDLYLFLIDSNILPRYKPQVERTRKRMVKLMTNFAKYGNPTPVRSELLPVKWEPVNVNKLNYLIIDVELLLETNPDKENLQFWENLVKNESADRNISLIEI